MNSTSTDWFAAAAYDRDKTAPAPASGFADTLPMPTAPFANALVNDDGDDDGGEWLPLPPRNVGELAEAFVKIVAACAGLGFGLAWAFGMASRMLNGG